MLTPADIHVSDENRFFVLPKVVEASGDTTGADSLTQ
jgi:hypothetical protein